MPAAPNDSPATPSGDYTKPLHQSRAASTSVSTGKHPVEFVAGGVGGVEIRCRADGFDQRGSLMKTKPILFHDIDGVLFGVYDEEFQLRPGIKPWLKWAHENFDVVWLTAWEPEKIKTLLSVVFAEKYLKVLPVIPVVCAEWKLCYSKAAWLHQNMSQ